MTSIATAVHAAHSTQPPWYQHFAGDILQALEQIPAVVRAWQSHGHAPMPGTIAVALIGAALVMWLIRKISRSA